MTTRHLTPLLAVAVLAGVAAAEPSADPEKRRVLASPSTDRSATPPDGARRLIGILDVRVEGVPDDIKVQFERGLEEQLENRIYWLSSRAQMRERMKFSTKWTEGCLVGPCLAELRAQTSAELVLLAAFSGSGTSFGHVVTLVRTDTGQVLAQEAGRCEVCTLSEAMAGATLATLRLLSSVPDQLPDPAGEQSAALERALRPVRTELAAERRGHRRAGIALTVIGLAAASAGLAAYFLDDEPDYALALTAAGAGTTLGGVVVLAF